jgi:pSer/pThr/pTyr-binding forkhead associated (FHA) protein
LTPIQLQIITGPGVTRREVFGETPVKFGREGDNHVVLAEPTASRYHGELRFVDGRWVLVNLSPNGTRVGGRSITRKPAVLRDRDTVAIGDKPVFHVLLDTTRQDAAHDETVPGVAPAKPRSRRSKLWVGIGVYVVLMLGFILFLSTLKKNEDQGTPQAPQLTAEQIEDEIARIPDVKVDAAEANEYLQDATARYQRVDASDRNLYEMVRGYKLAQAYSGKPLEGIDLQRYNTKRGELTDRVAREYEQAYIRLRTGEFRSAQERFANLTLQLYPDRNSLIYQNATQQMRHATEQLKRKRR